MGRMAPIWQQPLTPAEAAAFRSEWEARMATRSMRQ